MVSRTGPKAGSSSSAAAGPRALKAGCSGRISLMISPSSRLQGSSIAGTVRRIATPPPRRSTRLISGIARRSSNQWKASAANTARTLPSGSGISSARPARTRSRPDRGGEQLAGRVERLDGGEVEARLEQRLRELPGARAELEHRRAGCELELRDERVRHQRVVAGARAVVAGGVGEAAHQRVQVLPRPSPPDLRRRALRREAVIRCGAGDRSKRPGRIETTNPTRRGQQMSTQQSRATQAATSARTTRHGLPEGRRASPARAPPASARSGPPPRSRRSVRTARPRATSKS